MSLHGVVFSFFFLADGGDDGAALIEGNDAFQVLLLHAGGHSVDEERLGTVYLWRLFGCGGVHRGLCFVAGEDDEVVLGACEGYVEYVDVVHEGAQFFLTPVCGEDAVVFGFADADGQQWHLVVGCLAGDAPHHFLVFGLDGP